MAETDFFKHSTPELYDRYMGPLLFEPYAKHVAERLASLQPERILETAAGTGIVTRAVRGALPESAIVATDINPAVVGFAAERSQSELVSFQQADAEDLPVRRHELRRRPLSVRSDVLPGQGSGERRERGPFIYADAGQVEQDLRAAASRRSSSTRSSCRAPSRRAMPPTDRARFAVPSRDREARRVGSRTRGDCSRRGTSPGTGRTRRCPPTSGPPRGSRRALPDCERRWGRTAQVTMTESSQPT
jgi:methyltransferase family protein